MTDAQRAAINRLSADFTALSWQLAHVSRDLYELDQLLTQRCAPVPQPAPAPVPQPAPKRPAASRPARSEGWIGKTLAIAGVAVTLIGVVLLLVLAAQAGILRPEVRVAAGAVLAAALVVTAARLYGRPGGQIGSITLAATGIAAAYMDVIAVTAIYGWVPAGVGLGLAALVGGGGLTLARRWDSQQLGLLVLVPLIGLAPVVTDGIDLLLVGFMLALSAAALPVQIGKDWIWLHGSRTAAATLPFLPALLSAAFRNRPDYALVGACAAAATLAVTGALILLPRTTNRAAMGALTAVGAMPVLAVSFAADRIVAALMAAALAAALFAIVLLADHLPGTVGVVREIWASLSALSALIAVTVAFNGDIAGPVLLTIAVVLALAGRLDNIARWSAFGFAAVGGAVLLSYAPLNSLVRATELNDGEAVSTLTSSILVALWAAATVWAWGARGINDDTKRVMWAGAATVSVYAVTTFTVTAGVLAGGTGAGFLAGHMAATICWIAVAAALFGYAARVPRSTRSLLVGSGLALVAAALAKLFLFDLGTLDGVFRVVVFIVVGLVLLGMGGGYARLLARQDRQDLQTPEKRPV